MTFPIGFVEPELTGLMSGRLTFFRRLADGALAGHGPGDKLWIREPFCLLAKYDSMRPTQAMRLGALPVFLADLGASRAGLGKQRSARELCREWHRQHLVITSVGQERLQDLSDADLAAAGYASRREFALQWDRDISIRGHGCRWASNPAVLRFGFERVAEPLALPPRVGGPRPTTPEERATHRARLAEARKQAGPKRPAPVRAKTRAHVATVRAAPPPAPALPRQIEVRQVAVGRERVQAQLPREREWCAQCDRMVDRAAAAACGSPFCSLRVKAA